MGSEQQASGKEPHSTPVRAPQGHWRPKCSHLYAWALQRAYSAVGKALLSEAWEQAKILIKTGFPELW